MTVLDSFPAAINSAFKNLFYDAVMTVDVPQESPDPADPLPPVPTPYSCKAYVDKYTAYCPCSCWGCGNQRRAFRGDHPTMQERRFRAPSIES
jgi:hypothetical protein